MYIYSDTTIRTLYKTGFNMIRYHIKYCINTLGLGPSAAIDASAYANHLGESLITRDAIATAAYSIIYNIKSRL